MICYAIKNKYGEYILDPCLMSEDKPLFAKQLNQAFLCRNKKLLEDALKIRHLQDCKVVKVEIREVEDE